MMGISDTIRWGCRGLSEECDCHCAKWPLRSLGVGIDGIRVRWWTGTPRPSEMTNDHSLRLRAIALALRGTMNIRFGEMFIVQLSFKSGEGGI
jgi:hypothetical protein